MTNVPTLLLVEGSLSLLESFQESDQQGEDIPFLIKKANSLNEATKLLLEVKIDVILLTLLLPDSEGLDTFIKINEKVPHLPIVILSDKDDEQSALKSVQLGAQDYLVIGQFDIRHLCRALLYAIERNRNQEKIRALAERYSLATLGSKDGFWDWDLQSYQIYLSPRWKEMLGYRQGEVGTDIKEWFGRIHPEDYIHFRQTIDKHLAGAIDHFECEYRILGKGNTYHWMLAKGVAIRDENNAPYRMAGSQTDITQLKIAEEQLRHDALHDPLTGLPTRSYFLRHVDEALKRAAQQSSYLFAVLFLDLDNFKQINDSYGHQIGDELLIITAYRLQACIRTNDIAARLGGDEFVILLDKVESVKMACDVAERIQTSLHMPFSIGLDDLITSASIGVTLYNSKNKRPEDLLHNADKAMYEAKKSGKNRYVLYNQQILANVVESKLIY